MQSNAAHPARSRVFPIVGVGASAGGLEALRRMLQAMPDEPGVALVVIQHLDPTKRSLAPELFGKYTRLAVRQVEDASQVEPNCIYVLPPGKYMGVVQGELQLVEPSQPRAARMAVDYFLRSLASNEAHFPVAVILSGTGTDGTLGIKAIKAAGGLVIAQDPLTAEHQGMPRSAIATGVVDHILAPEKVPEVLVRYAQHPYVREPGDTPAIDEDKESALLPRDGLNAILALLRKHAKHDFRNYKEKAIVRRTRRRMCLYHIDDYDQYLQYLREHPEEINALASDLLITVTDFFRDPEAWEELRQQVIVPMVAAKADDAPVRVWTPGGATGEEPCSVAMLMLEELQRAGKCCPLQVFATDIDKVALDYARSGRYPKSIEADVSPERLRRFFTSEDGDDYYRVNKMLREAVVFAEQNLIGDPPFSKLDLVCCRNVLIYLKPEVQERVIALFHFALNDGGVLFLGSAETIGRQTDLFQTLDKRWRLFRRVGPTRHDRVDIPLTTIALRHDIEPTSPPPPRRESRLTHLAQQQLLDLLAPDAVLINRHWHMLYICGDIDPYVTRRPGVPSDHLLDNARRGLRTKLRSAVHQALAQKETVSVNARLPRSAAFHTIQITVRVVRDQDLHEDMALVVFDQPNAAATSAEQTPGDAADPRTGQHGDSDVETDTMVRQLEEELAHARDDLQATIEQFEASNEEYKAANEEVMSINEELQSTNEELETSKEELQSLNEELSTVNTQLAAKVDELETKHSDLENLIAVTNVPTVCLDTHLAVRWFTPATQQLIRLKPADCGRPLADFSHDFNDDDLLPVSRRVLAELTPVVDEVGCHDGRTFLRRVSPYRTSEHRIGGVVITFWDITQRKQDEESLRASSERLRRMVNVEKVAVLIYDESGTLVDANDAMLRMFGYERDDVAAGKLNRRVFTPPQYIDIVEQKLQLLATTGHSGPYEIEYLRKSGSRFWAMLVSASLGDATTVEYCIDISDRKRAEDALQKLNMELERRVADQIQHVRHLATLVEVAHDAIIIRTTEGFITSWNKGAQRLYGYAATEVIGKPFDVLVPPEHRSELLEKHERLLRGEVVQPFEALRLRKDGQVITVSVALSAMKDARGNVFAIASISRDVTSLRAADERRRLFNEQIHLVTDAMAAPVAHCSRDLRYVWVSRPYARWLDQSPDNIVGQRVVDVLGSTAFEKLMPRIQSVLAGQEVRYEEEVDFPALGRRWVSATYTPTLDPSGVPDGWVAVIMDIDQRKRAEQALLQRAAQQAAVAALSQRALVERDPLALMREAVQAVAAVLDTEYSKVLELVATRQQLLVRAGVGWHEGSIGKAVVGTGSNSQAGCALQSSTPIVVEDYRTETRFQRSTLLREHDVLSGVSCRVAGPAGKPYGVLSAHSAQPRRFSPEDVHFLESVANVLGSFIQRTRTERDLKAKTEEIRSTTQQLWQAAKLATVGELAASIAHELNNPLSTVRLRIESVLARTAEDDPRRGPLEIVEQESKRMGNLVANLLQFAHHGPDLSSEINLHQEITQSVDLIRHQLEQRRIQVVQDTQNAPALHADHQKLRQVFLNLLTNASDAMPEGGTLSLRTRADALPDGTPAVHIEVRDTGFGIATEDIDKVFDPFFTTKAEGRGTGLGLAICRRVVEEHRGTIRIASQRGTGTTVRIVLPVQSDPNRAASRRQE